MKKTEEPLTWGQKRYLESLKKERDEYTRYLRYATVIKLCHDLAETLLMTVLCLAVPLMAYGIYLIGHTIETHWR